MLSSTITQSLGLVHLNVNALQLSKTKSSQPTEMQHVQDSQTKDILRQHKMVMDGIGKLKGKQIPL